MEQHNIMMKTRQIMDLGYCPQLMGNEEESHGFWDYFDDLFNLGLTAAQSAIGTGTATVTPPAVTPPAVKTETNDFSKYIPFIVIGIIIFILLRK